MCKSISSIIKRFALVPLVFVAVAMVLFSSYMRYLDAKSTLERERHIAVQFLKQPAAEAISLGKTAYLRKLLAGTAVASGRIICIAIRDNDRHVVASNGRCSKRWPGESAIRIYSSYDTLSDVKSASTKPEQIGDLILTMNRDLFSAEIRLIVIQLLFASIIILIVFVLMNITLKKRLVRPFNKILRVVNAIQKQDYSQRIVGVNKSDELGQLAESLNRTIVDIDRYTTQLKTSRDEATAALIAADDASLARESLMQSLSHDLTEPAQQMNKALTYLAMHNSDTTLSQPIQHVLKLGQDLSSTFDDLLAIATTDASDVASSQSSISLSDLLTNLEAMFPEISDSINFDIDYRTSAAPVPEIADQMFVTLDMQKIKRLIDHICKAMVEQCNGTMFSIVTHVVELEQHRINVSVDFRATYPPDMMPSISGEQINSLPSFFSENERLLIQSLRRLHDIDIVHMHSKTGTFNLSASLTLPLTTGADHSPLLEQQTRKKPRIAIISNDQQVLKLSSRASLAKENIVFIRPEQCHRSAPEFMNPLDCIAIDTGTGTADDFDHRRVIDVLKSIPAQKNVVFSAIVDEAILTNAFIEQLINCGYSGTLRKPITLARLREELACLITAAKQTSQPFELFSEHA